MYKVGIVGMGKMGRFHAGWVAENKELTLAALCESNPERRIELQKLYDVPVYDDYDRFLDEAGLDIVIVVTTNPSHEPLTVKALNKKKTVIVEKPMSLTYSSARNMIEAAEKNGRQIYVHQSSRWDRDYLLLKQLMESGKLGRILSIQSKVMLCDNGWPSWGIDGIQNPWRIKAEFGGGMLYDWGSHLVDQMIQLMNRAPISVYGRLQSGVWSSEVDDYTFAMLNFGDDTVCQIEISNNSLIDLPRWHVIGTNGTFLVEGRKEPVWELARVHYKGEDGKFLNEAIEFVNVQESGTEGGFYKDLIPHMEGSLNDFVSMYQAGEVIRVLEAIKESSLKDAVVEIKY